MAETWGNPEKKMVAASEPVIKGGEHQRDKYITAALKYNVRFEGESRATWVFCTTEPQAGEEIEVFKLTSGEFSSYWTTAAKELKTKPRGGGGFGGGAKPNYSLEQEALKDGLTIAMMGLSTGSFRDAEKNVAPCDSANLLKYGGAIAKMIMEAGK